MGARQLILRAVKDPHNSNENQHSSSEGPVPLTPDKWRPDLFEPLGRAEREGLVNGLAVNWRENWVPNREDVEDRLALRGGATSLDELARRYRTAHAFCRSRPSTARNRG